MSFWCCGSQEPEYKYEVKSLVNDEHGSPRETFKYYNSLEEVDHLEKENENVSITKVKTQLGLKDLQNEIRKKGEKFTDHTFPPDATSLGNIPGIIYWKRIPQLLSQQQPVLFDNKIEPKDVITGHQGDCYMLSSLAALAECPSIVRRIFRGQSYNPEGLYKVSLRVDGEVEEVLIDDYIPVHENGQPVFCQPNRKTGQIWVVLLQKALAKVSGSYANLNEGIPSEVFREVTYAPSESLVFSQQSEQKQKVWRLLNDYTSKNYPFCATTKAQIATSQGLERSHTYTVVSAMEVESSHGQARVVKLRNPWKQVVDYKGIASPKDHQFWDSIRESPQKTLMLNQSINDCSYGLFTMRFQDFCRNFNQVHYCIITNGGKFLSEQLLLSNKACFFEVSVQRQGSYTFEINQAKRVFKPQQSHSNLQQNQSHAHENFQQSYVEPHQPLHGQANFNIHGSDFQSPQKDNLPELHEIENVNNQINERHPQDNWQNHSLERPQSPSKNRYPAQSDNQAHAAEEEHNDVSDCRSTLLIIKKEKAQNGFRYAFVNGTMKYQINTIITEQLIPGEYIIYAKVDPSFRTNKFPSSARLNLYSKNFATLEPVLRTKYPNLLHDTFLDHAMHNTRGVYNQGKICMGWQLFFQKGGFAYLAGENSKQSQQAVVINYNQEDFNQLHFKLKKPYKGHSGPQTIKILPGQMKIIVARVINNPNVKSIRFPPKLDIKLEAFHP